MNPRVCESPTCHGGTLEAGNSRPYRSWQPSPQGLALFGLGSRVLAFNFFSGLKFQRFQGAYGLLLRFRVWDSGCRLRVSIPEL